MERDAGVDVVRPPDARHSADDLAAVATALNTRPCKTLGWKTPAEVLDEYLTATTT